MSGPRQVGDRRTGLLLTLLATVGVIAWAILRGQPLPPPPPPPVEPPPPEEPQPPRGFRIGPLLLAAGAGALGWAALRTVTPTVTLLVPVRRIPALSRIRAQDLPPDHAAVVATGPSRTKTALFRVKPVAWGAGRDLVTQPTDLLDRCPRVALAAGKGIRKSDLLELPHDADLAGTVAVGLTASAAMLQGGAIEAGDWVDLFCMRRSSGAESSTGTHAPLSRTFTHLLVLDIHRGLGKSTAEAAESKPASPAAPDVVILALPVAGRQAFAEASAGAEILLTRSPQAGPSRK